MDKQRAAYQELLDRLIPEWLNSAGYTKDNRYKVSFKMYPIDTINYIEEGGTIFTILKTFCTIKDLYTDEQQEIIIDLLKIPVFQELGFKIRGNYRQVLDLYDKPAGWSFKQETRIANTEPYQYNEARLVSANYKTIVFVKDKQAPYFYCSKNVGDNKTEKSQILISVFFRALTGYTNAELLELFGYDNPYNTLTFSDNEYIATSNASRKNIKSCKTRSDCIEMLYNALFSHTEEMNIEEKLHNVKNWFFKKSYLDLGAGNGKRFEYIQSFKNRALNRTLAEDVQLLDELLQSGTTLTADTLDKIDNSPVTCIKVNYDGKVHSLMKFSTLTFRALGYTLVEDVNVENGIIKAGTKLTITDLKELNESNLDKITVTAGKSNKDAKIIMARTVDASVLTIEDLFTAYSIFANNINGYDYVSDIDELTDKIVVPLDKKVLSRLSTNINNFINKLNVRLDLLKHKDSGRIIDALTDFSDAINKDGLLSDLANVDTKESQMSDINNVMSFIAKDFKVTNQSGGKNATDSLIGVHGLEFGRLDPYDSPESGKIGIVHHRTLLAKEDEDGYLTVPYTAVSNGEILDRVDYLSATDEKDLYIAAWDETFLNEDGTKKDRVLCRYKGELTNVDVSAVHYKEYSSLQNLSPTTASIPFLNFAAGKRLQMSDNQIKQAVNTPGAERARVCTGVESLLNTGVYRAKEILSNYYNEQVYNVPEIASYKEQILNSDLQLIRINSEKELRKLTMLVVEATKLNLENLVVETSISIPFAQHTMKSDMFSYRINAGTGGLYSCNDIVAYNTSYDMTDYNIDGVINYGDYKIDDEQLKGSLALGHNYCVAFKTMESSSIDDGIVISSAIVADDTITSIMIYKESVELFDKDTESFEAPREKANGQVIERFNENGLPKIGTYLYPGDIVVWKKIIKTGPVKGEHSSERFEPKSLGKYTEGQVIHTAIVKKSDGKVVAEVYLAYRASGEVADKFAGRIGNKGVVAKIIPEEMMPYDPETGRTVDFILNPLGVPSRMNITQLLEVTLAAAATKNNEIAIVSPFHPDSLSYVIEKAGQANIHPKKLIDGRTGEYFEREINVGYQYMYKLVHMARKNIHAVGLHHGVNAVTLQAKSSAKLNGGQSIGEMESWCFEGVGANKVLQELQSTLSDDRDARKELEGTINRNPYYINVKGTNHNDVMMTTLLRLLGCEVTNGIDASGETYYEFNPLTDKFIKSFCPKSVGKDSLHNVDVFGSNTPQSKMDDRYKWGWIDLNTEIVHPIWIERGNLSKLFLVSTAKEVKDKTFTPPAQWDKNNITEEECRIQWKKVCGAGKWLLRDIKDCKLYVRCIEGDNMSILYTIRNDEKSSFAFDFLSDEGKQHYKTGFEAISYIFTHYDLNNALSELSAIINKRDINARELSYEELKAIRNGSSFAEVRANTLQEAMSDKIDDYDYNDPTAAYNYKEANSTLIKNKSRYNYIKEFIASGSRLSDYLITSYPVMPAIYRPTLDNDIRSINDFDARYCEILEQASKVNDVESQSSRLAVYNAISDFVGINSNATSGKKSYATVLSWFTGKDQKSSNAKHHGKIRETVQKKIVGRSGRSIIIPSDDPKRGPMYIGLPFTMATDMYAEQLRVHLENYIVERPEELKLTVKDYRMLFLALSTDNTAKFIEIYNSTFAPFYQMQWYKAKQKFMQWITEFVEGTDGKPIGPNGMVLEPQVVLFGRQPSLHRYSIRAFYPKIVFTKALQVHPIVCSGYNADFDGDQMWVVALISEEAKSEAIEKMSAKSDIVNPKNGEIILTHSQDIALGLYVMTMLKDNKLELEDKAIKYYYSSIDLLKSDILDGIIHSWDLVAYTEDSKHFVSTAGRILFNSIIPGGFSAENGTFTNKWGIDIRKPERYAELLYDGLITSGKSADNYKSFKLSKICKDLYDRCIDDDWFKNMYGTAGLLDVYQNLTEIGFKMSDRHSVSISIFDLKAISDKSNKKEILANAENVQKLIEKDYQDGLLSEEDKVAVANEVYKQAFNDIEVDIFGNGADKNGIIDRNNNLFIMFDSGARGSKGQIMQSIGAVGFLQKTKDENLKLPVLGNYSEGLSSFDFQMLAYSTRTGMASTQNETSNSGYATRRAVHCTSGLEIVKLDCGKTDWWYDITWGQRIDSYSNFTPTRAWFNDCLLGESVDTNDVNTMNLFGETLENGKITERSFDCLQNGFNTIKLETQTIKVNPEMLIGTKPIDDESIKYLKYFTKDGLLTRSSKNVIDKRHLKHLETDIGVFEFRYKVSDLSRSLLKNREARNLPGLHKYKGPLHDRLSSDMYIMTDETIKWIEQSGKERIEARILLDCRIGWSDNGEPNKTLHGCCARCYGLKYTSNTLPELHENVGIEAAQAIGEPAAQLTLSLVNKGGATGESVASGVDILHKILDGSNMYTDAYKMTPLVAKESGYLNVETLDKKTSVSITLVDKDGNNSVVVSGQDAYAGAKGSIRINAQSLVCKDKEWINAGEPITKGYVIPANIIKIPSNSEEELIRAKQIVWLSNWFKTFDDSGITINARHFELFTIAQMSDMLVVKSNNPDYVVGKRYKMSDVMTASGVIATLDINKCSETILNSSGALAVLSYENIMSSLPDMAQQHYRSYKNSPTGALNLGESLVTKEKKILTKPILNYRRSDDDFNEIDIKYDEPAPVNFEDLNPFEAFDSLDGMDLFADVTTSEEAISKQENTESEDDGMINLLDEIDTNYQSKEPEIIENDTILNDMALFDDVTEKSEEVDSDSENKLCNLTFAILDKETFMPYEGYDVILSKENKPLASSVSDSFGNVTFADVKPGNYSVSLPSDELIGDTMLEIAVNPDDIINKELLVTKIINDAEQVLPEESSYLEDTDEDIEDYDFDDDDYDYSEDFIRKDKKRYKNVKFSDIF
jgi:DNA-directed RNA polymerase beta subunit/DNA-directed RNA polymerase beta' subunit